jgi:hypothetical protein
MNKTTLKRIKRRIDRLRDKEVSSKVLESIAESLGMARSKRGHEPTWKLESLNKRPITIPIPHHGKKVIRYTVNSILDDFESIIFDLQENLED